MAIIGIVVAVTFAGSSIRYPELPAPVGEAGGLASDVDGDGTGSAFASRRPPV